MLHYLFFHFFSFLTFSPSTHWNVYKTLVTEEFRLSISYLVLSLVFINKLPEPIWMVSEKISFIPWQASFPRRIVRLIVRCQRRSVVFSSRVSFKNFTSRKIYIRACIIYNSRRPKSRTLFVSIGKKTWSDFLRKFSWIPRVSPRL